jgi:hypothetical protein
MRIAPTTVAAAAALAAELKIEGRQVARWEGAVATAAPGSHHQQVLLNHIARTEHRMEMQEVRLARIEARVLARFQASPFVRVKGQPSPPPPTRTPGSPPPFTVFAATAVAPAATETGGSSTSTTSGSQAGGSGDVGSQQHTLPPNASVTLDVIYDAYIQDPSGFAADLPSTGAADKVVIQGTNVGIQVHDNNPADFANLVSQLQSDGMQITASSASYGMVMGMLPIAQLPAVAGLPGAPSVTPIFQPVLM